MEYKETWMTIGDSLGQGGQGTVYKVIRLQDFNYMRRMVAESIQSMSQPYMRENTNDYFEQYLLGTKKLIDLDKPENQGALKVLHEPGDARDTKLAADRIRNEIKGMQSQEHPNLLKIIDVDPDSKWFVSEFHPNGTLHDSFLDYIDNPLYSLTKFRRLVDGVAQLHKNGIVHRDIKPKNIFRSYNDELVMGDFGLIFFIDDEHSRISEKFDNVGTHDWMPGWAMGVKVEDVKPAFDVFSLGKVLWSMLSGSPKLQLWYYDDPRFNLVDKFPGKPEYQAINKLLGRCIVEKEPKCIPTASDLLDELDNLFYKVQNQVEDLAIESKRKCKVCGIGEYQVVVDGEKDPHLTQTRNFGFDPRGNRTMRIAVCNSCGNVQIFAYDLQTRPKAWLN